MSHAATDAGAPGTEQRRPSPGRQRVIDLRYRAGQTLLVWGATLLLLVVVVIVFPRTLSYGSLATLTPLVGVLLVAAIGQSLVIATGGIDLSVSSVITLVGIVVVGLGDGTAAGTVRAVLVGILVGAGYGLVNGILVEYLRLSALVATLATGQVGLGIASVWYTLGANTSAVPPGIKEVVSPTIGGVSVVLLGGLVVVVLVGTFLGSSALGRRFSAASVSVRAALYQGMRVRSLRASSYVAAGVLYSLCGIALVGLLGTPTLSLGTTYQLSTIVAVVLGGASLAGGRIRPAATVAGALFLSLSNQAIAATGLPAGTQSIAQGLILIASMLLVASGFIRPRGSRAGGGTPRRPHPVGDGPARAGDPSPVPPDQEQPPGPGPGTSL